MTYSLKSGARVIYGWRAVLDHMAALSREPAIFLFHQKKYREHMYFMNSVKERG